MFPRALPLALAALALAAAPAGAHEPTTPEGAPIPKLDWRDCDDGFQCATAEVPRDYSRPRGPKIKLAVVRRPAVDQAHRIGSLFLNPGGPGGSGVEFVRFAPPPAFDLLARFDWIGFDPRGVGESEPAVDCDEADLPPLMTPETLDVPALLRTGRDRARLCLNRDPDFLASLSTANAARDMDVLRAAVGDATLSYVGLSWGGVLGETYASLFPGRARALVLDSPGDGDTWLNRPLQAGREQAASFESSLQRFFRACNACAFAGADPEEAYDDLIARLDATPLDLGDGIHLDGEDLTDIVISLLSLRQAWPTIGAALADAQAGRVELLRQLAGDQIGADRLFDVFRSYDFVERRYPRRLEPFLESAEHVFALAPHFARGSYEGVDELFWPVDARNNFTGPFRNAASATPVLVIHSTHDPNSPYAWGKRIVRDLGNARLLTFRGDGHTVIPQFNGCVLGHLVAYLNDRTVPPEGASCRQAPTATGARVRADSTAAWHIARLSRLSRPSL
jgi:pimeloyl-ACP methyl ester carboxylesterase